MTRPSRTAFGCRRPATRPGPSRRLAVSFGLALALGAVSLGQSTPAHAETAPQVDLGAPCPVYEVFFPIADGGILTTSEGGAIAIPVDLYPDENAPLLEATTATLTDANAATIPGSLAWDTEIDVLVWTSDAPLTDASYTLTLEIDAQTLDSFGCGGGSDVTVVYDVLVQGMGADPTAAFTPSISLQVLTDTVTECCPAGGCWVSGYEAPYVRARSTLEIANEAPLWFTLEHELVGHGAGATAERVVPGTSWHTTDDVLESDAGTEICAQYTLVSLVDGTRMELNPVCADVASAPREEPPPVEEPLECETEMEGEDTFFHPERIEYPDTSDPGDTSGGADTSGGGSDGRSDGNQAGLETEDVASDTGCSCRTVRTSANPATGEAPLGALAGLMGLLGLIVVRRIRTRRERGAER